MKLLKLSKKERGALQELYANMDPDLTEVIERDYIAAIAEERARAILDNAVIRLARRTE